MKNDYASIRPQIKSGDLLFFSHVGWNSWHDLKIQAIRIWTRSEYSHVAVAWVVANRVFALESVTPLTRNFPLSKLGDFSWFPMNAPWKPETEEYALEHLGEKYSQLQAIQSVFTNTPRNGLWQCCKYAKSILEKDGITWDGKEVPSDMAQSLQELGYNPIFVKNPGK